MGDAWPCVSVGALGHDRDGGSVGVTQTDKPFNLLRWFAWLSPVAIGLIALANAWLITSFLNSHLFQREAAISRDFVQNILLSDGSLGYLAHPEDPALKARFSETVKHFANMTDILRTNVYGANRELLWSSDPTLTGQHFAHNDELDEALMGDLVVHAGHIASAREKDEHVGLDPSIHYFVESYIPVLSQGQVVGVVELYKAPLALTEAIYEARMQVGLAAVASALALYVCLYGLVRRADRMIKQQRSRLLEAETLAMVGELTASVAHNIRNPLSSIRSAAEVVLEFPREDCSEQAGDIIREVDRLSLRINELLRLSGKGAQSPEAVDLGALLGECVKDHEAAFRGRAQSLELRTPPEPLRVQADRALLLQVFISILSNAAEAMPAGGCCRLELDAESGRARVRVTDSGCGFDGETGRQIFRPFFTTKPKGLGLGLPLARRIVERFGGSLTIDSQPGTGTTVSISLPTL